MNLQYISDSEGKTTGVFIPISEWNELKTKYKGIDEVQPEIPDSHIEEVKRRKSEYDHDPKLGLDFDAALIDVDDGL